MDAVTLDALLAEVAPRIVGRRLGRVRLAGPQAVRVELPGREELWLWWEAGRAAPGPYLLNRAELRRHPPVRESDVSGRTRHALLLVRKHLEGARVTALRRIPGERWLELEAGVCRLLLRIGGAAPALTIAVGDAPLAHIGEGGAAWPAPVAAPGRDWNRVDPVSVAAAVAAAVAGGGSGVRAVLALCPGLGPRLARFVAEAPGGFPALRRQLEAARPSLFLPVPGAACDDAALSAGDAVQLLPAPLLPGREPVHSATWREATASYLELRLRGARFVSARQARLAEVRARSRRLARLEAHLQQDLRTLPDEPELRRHAEALLAFAGRMPSGARELEVTDPYRPPHTLRVKLDPRLTLPANAERLFDKARRLSRARASIALRLADAQRQLSESRGHERAVDAARALQELEPGTKHEEQLPPGAGGGPRQYLTSHGLSLHVGRGARENHRLTFGLARPEDFWLHARDVPGAHVILRDAEGRAAADDLREAAEVAAYFSEAREQPQADVHVARRKHVRPSGSGPGRVRIAHSETLRVVPRDPEGRLRRR